MTGILPRLLALTLCIFPSALFALGLGDIRLKSALNEPLDAEIELVSATPDELASLRAALASRETFARYGLDRPNFLASIDFRVGRSDDGRNVLYVRSRESVSDPFLTFLVEVNWSRGRLLREYTLLLDPPVYMPGGEQQAPAPVAAPEVSAGTTTSGAVARPTQQQPVSEPTAPGTSQPSPSMSAQMAGDGSYTVRRNDTLYQIARGMRPGSASEINRMMIALYRANPEAFRGNMNELRAGAILRQPAEADLETLSSGEALAEVRRQYADWRTSRGTAGTTSEESRLRLVTPTEGGEGTSAAAAQTAAENRALQNRVNELEGELSEARRALEVQNAELARLQQQARQPEQPTATPPEQAQPAPETPATAEETPAEPAAEAPAEETPAAAAEPEPTPAAERPARAREEAEEAGLVDWLISHWYVPAGVVLLLAAFIIAMLRRRQEPDYGALGRMAAAEAAAAPRPARADREPSTAPIRAPKQKDEDFLVEESGERTQLRPNRTAEIPRIPEKAAPKPRSVDDTLSSETAINLDQGDPLAEADFHMAYGLYDQAADLVRIAIEREPQRRDLKLKLLEIFFVWGNKDSFLQMARQLHHGAAEAGPGEWDKIVIMGRQIAPEDPLFSQAAPTGAGGDVDLNLEGGENRVDLDLLDGPEGDRASGSIDLDLGDAEGSTAATSEQPALHMDAGLDFPLEDAPEPSDGSATTREMAARTMETPTIEQPHLGGHDAPTVESPALRDRGTPTIKEKVDAALFRKEAGGQSDQTAELALDDLGLDLDALRQADGETTLDSLEQTDHPSDAATMVAGMDEKSRRLMAAAESRSRSDEDTIEEAGKSPTGTWVLDDKTLAATVQLPGGNTDNASTDRVRALDPDTARARRLDVDSTAEMGGLSEEEMDLDLDRLEKALQSDTARQPRSGSTDEDRFSSDVFAGGDFVSTDIDVDVGAVKRDRNTEQTGTARIPATEMTELEPVTMSEVGTKLDLARAYMDMGDPEGARSILEEVLQEGSSTQKQEAQRLIDSLPG
jgi:pilus assembly protein FimV